MKNTRNNKKMEPFSPWMGPQRHTKRLYGRYRSTNFYKPNFQIKKSQIDFATSYVLQPTPSSPPGRNNMCFLFKSCLSESIRLLLMGEHSGSHLFPVKPEHTYIYICYINVYDAYCPLKNPWKIVTWGFHLTTWNTDLSPKMLHHIGEIIRIHQLRRPCLCCKMPRSGGDAVYMEKTQRKWLTLFKGLYMC